MHPDSAKYLWDVRYAAALVERFIAGKGFDEYASDLLVKSAVERQLEIIGEALNALHKVDPELAKRVPDSSQIIAFRNILIHGYAVIKHERVWTVANESVPILLNAVQALLLELGDDP